MPAKGRRKLTRPGGLLFDECDRTVVESYTWTLRPDGYAVTTIDGRMVRCHRLILGTNRRVDVDHINGNTLDNRRFNLREVSHAENMANRVKLDKRNASGYRGVSLLKSGKWGAWVKIDHKSKSLGTFRSAQEAALAAHEYRAAHMPGYVTPSEIFELLDEKSEIERWFQARIRWALRDRSDLSRDLRFTLENNILSGTNSTY